MSEIVKSKLSTDKPLNPHNANENKVNLIEALNKIKIEKK